MLKTKKITNKKLILYIITIVAMFSGTGYFIYLNYSLTAGNSPSEYSKLSYFNEFENLNKFNQEEIGGNSGIIKREENDDINILGAGIFSDPKYRALKEYTAIKTRSAKIGKENPFKPAEDNIDNTD